METPIRRIKSKNPTYCERNNGSFTGSKQRKGDHKPGYGEEYDYADFSDINYSSEYIK